MTNIIALRELKYKIDNELSPAAKKNLINALETEKMVKFTVTKIDNDQRLIQFSLLYIQDIEKFNSMVDKVIRH